MAGASAPGQSEGALGGTARCPATGHNQGQIEVAWPST